MKKILVLTANPKNTDKLRLDEEVREIQAGLERARRRDQFEVISRWAVRPSDLRRALLDYEPQIVHFSGHGAGSQGLALENDAGQMQLVSTAALARLFKLFKDKIECVLLNACYSEAQAEAIYQHIDYVIGMNQAIGDRAAICFAVGFYDGLGAGRSFEDAYELGCTSVDLESIPESATPVLKAKPQSPTSSIENKSLQLEPIKPEMNLGSSAPICKVEIEENFPAALYLGEQKRTIPQVEEVFRYDAYISYVEKEPDETWVWDTLVPKLKEAGLEIAVSGDSEKPGIAHVINVEQGIQQSKRTIVVLSETYLTNNMAEFENTLGQTMGLQEGTYRLLPVKAMPLDTSRLPVRLSMLTTLDLAHPRRAEREFTRLIEALRQPLPRM